ncbi:ABC-2 type transport system permease protein [Neorhizobium galegae]|uniref:ABC transporter permease n=1 Tax=Neorhizobium galegae TaxID=399 RepID=UPI001AE7E36E|nr:ABC transporter permease [Neorhizobium galegae]MBP2550735.1 ABC-2 type transport system permease protein [Neorhizobium galegae]
MKQKLARIIRLGIKELYSLKADPVMIILILYAFTIAIYTVATGAKSEVENASVAVVDEDRSMLSARLRDGLMQPFFQTPVLIEAPDVDPAMDGGTYTFVLEIPPNFERDVIAGRRPSVQIAVDATAMSLAGTGATYIQSIIRQEVAAALPKQVTASPINLVISARFNPNLMSTWFNAVMQVINNVTMLSVILTGAALIREREHGTIEHLLVMPVTPGEIMLSKIWANGLVIVVAAVLSLTVVVERVLHVPIAGSLGLFIASAVLYQFSVTSLGILIATASTSMAQFGLIAIPVLIAMNLLSGSTTPMESMPVFLQTVMQVSPSTHFVALSQAILYRGADFFIVWPQMLALAVVGCGFFAIALLRFRRSLMSAA